MLYIGKRPTFYSKLNASVVIEIHIFDFNRYIYGEHLEVIFVKKIREENIFENNKSLVEQLRKDEEKARKILNKVKIGKKMRCVKIL